MSASARRRPADPGRDVRDHPSAPGAAQAYIEFLKSGGSMYPQEALKRAGVDLATPQPIDDTFVVLSELVDRLEQLFP